MKAERWVIDGMNLIGSRPDRWWNDPDAAMLRMVRLLDDYAARSGRDITVVFDTEPKGSIEVAKLQVVIASRRGRNAADHEIESLIARDPNPGEIRVVTSDKELAESVRRLGARVVGAGEFRNRLDN